MAEVREISVFVSEDGLWEPWPKSGFERKEKFVPASSLASVEAERDRLRELVEEAVASPAWLPSAWLKRARAALASVSRPVGERVADSALGGER